MTDTYNEFTTPLLELLPEDAQIVTGHCTEGGTATKVHIVFSNGFTVSIRWDYGAYSSVGRGLHSPEEDLTVETAVFYTSSGGWYNPKTRTKWLSLNEGDQVQGWQTKEDVKKLVEHVVGIKSAVDTLPSGSVQRFALLEIN